MARKGSEEKNEGETASAVSPDGPLAIWARVRVLLALLLMLGAATAGVNADDVNRAGLVIVHGDGRIVTRCIDFAEPQITGMELLTAVRVGPERGSIRHGRHSLSAGRRGLLLSAAELLLPMRRRKLCLLVLLALGERRLALCADGRSQ